VGCEDVFNRLRISIYAPLSPSFSNQLSTLNQVSRIQISVGLACRCEFLHFDIVRSYKQGRGLMEGVEGDDISRREKVDRYLP